MAGVIDSILQAVGHTPLVRLHRIPGADCADILVKVEGLNVGGSIKTRTALNMLMAAERDGRECDEAEIGGKGKGSADPVLFHGNLRHFA